VREDTRDFRKARVTLCWWWCKGRQNIYYIAAKSCLLCGIIVNCLQLNWMKETMESNIWQKNKLLQVLIRLAIGEESDNKLDEPQESTIRKLAQLQKRRHWCGNQLCGLFNKSKIAGIL